jgi:hypothetical protein
VDPDAKAIQVHVLESGRYVSSAYGRRESDDADEIRYVSDSAPFATLSGLSIDLKTIFSS